MAKNKIKKLRVDIGISQKEMAKKLNISVDYVSMIERGIRTPGFKLAKRIADLFGCTIDEVFFNGTDYKMSDNDEQVATSELT